MAKSNKKRKSNSAAERFAPPAKTSTRMPEKPPTRWGLVALFLLISVGGTYIAISTRPKPSAPRYKAVEINKYPHDTTAFTQGFLMDGGFLWESTGLNGKSTIRKVELETGKVLKEVPLDKEHFAEGLVLLNDKFYQQTWKSGKAFVYDRDLNRIGEIPYQGEGWGLATDGKHLIFSDGSTQIRFVEPETFETVRTISVFRRSTGRVYELNELEYYEGKIYANRWKSENIYEIDPETGNVTKTISLAGLWPKAKRPDGGLMNGIAVNEKTGKMLVTGKYCPYVYEVDLVPEKQ
jgi:glutaminyl-peptide cyclotransferase